MREQIIVEEQRDVDQTIATIEKRIDDLCTRAYPTTPEGYSLAENHRQQVKNLTKVVDKPYIGKLVLLENGEPVTYRIGRQAVADEEGLTNIVVNWKTPFGDLFYSFLGGEGNTSYEAPESRQEVTILRKRTVTIIKRIVENVRDVLSDQAAADEGAPQGLNDDRLMQFWFEHKGNHQIREIIASIQKEQNEMIRLGIDAPVLIQGAAGSGKTSIALHRISYLLYQYPSQLQADRIMILAPNRMFLHSMQQVVEELEITGIRQETVYSFCQQLLPEIKKIKTGLEWMAEWQEDPGAAAESGQNCQTKTSLSFKEIITRHCETLEAAYLPSTQNLNFKPLIPLENNISDIFTGIYNGYRHLPLNRRREETIKSIRSWMKMEIKRQEKGMEDRLFSFKKDWLEGEGSDASIKQTEANIQSLMQKKLARLRDSWDAQLQVYLSSWKNIHPLNIYRDICLVEGIPAPFDKDSIGYEDLGALIFLEEFIRGIEIQLDYLVIDEAQDYYPFLLDCLVKRTKSLTLLGDLAQSINPWMGIENWNEIEPIFRTPVHRMDTAISYRSTKGIMDVANHIITTISKVAPIVPVRLGGEVPSSTGVMSAEELVKQVRNAIVKMLDAGRQTIAVIAKEKKLVQALYQMVQQSGMENIQLIEDADTPLSGRVVFLPAIFSKGLEFEGVIIPNANPLSYSTKLDAKLLFVSITRAQEALELFYFDQMSPWLSEYTFN